MSDPEVILHHYPRSPFAEEIRLAFGLKPVRWRSVIQPHLAPKRALAPLTSGYRGKPVLQIGAGVYCDTCCILAELTGAPPSPHSLRGTGWGAEMIAAWADRFPLELHADRTRFTAGKFDGGNSTWMKEKLPAPRAIVRARQSP